MESMHRDQHTSLMSTAQTIMCMSAMEQSMAMMPHYSTDWSRLASDRVDVNKLNHLGHRKFVASYSPRITSSDLGLRSHICAIYTLQLWLTCYISQHRRVGCWQGSTYHWYPPWQGGFTLQFWENSVASLSSSQSYSHDRTHSHTSSAVGHEYASGCHRLHDQGVVTSIRAILMVATSVSAVTLWLNINPIHPIGSSLTLRGQ